MNHPPYHLRSNKAIDRFLFIDLLTMIDKIIRPSISDFIYHGFGGPFLEDFRVLHQSFPDLRMKCIERDPNTYKRQLFNKPHKKISFENEHFSDYLATCNFEKRNIFWLDNIGLEISHFEEFESVLEKIDENEIIKITLGVDSKKKFPAQDQNRRTQQIDSFRDGYSDFMPLEANDPAYFRQANFPKLVFKMLNVCAQRMFPTPDEKYFQILNAFTYQDGAPMLTMTGIVLTGASDPFLGKIKKWKYCNLDWSSPTKINVPDLSVKERLKLEQALPVASGSVILLKKRLGYELGDTAEETIEKLKQYANFYRYYPYFSKVVP